MENPLELVYSWQALLVAVAASGLTQLVKTSLDVYWGQKSEVETPTYRDAARVGADLRRKKLILNRLVFPALTTTLGACVAVLLPVLPEALLRYMEAQEISGWGEYGLRALWGAACGQFASYLFDRVKEFFVPRSST